MDFMDLYSKGVEIYSNLNSSLRDFCVTAPYKFVSLVHGFMNEMNKPHIMNLNNTGHQGFAFFTMLGEKIVYKTDNIIGKLRGRAIKKDKNLEDKTQIY